MPRTVVDLDFTGYAQQQEETIQILPNRILVDHDGKRRCNASAAHDRVLNTIDTDVEHTAFTVVDRDRSCPLFASRFVSS